jgi:hypothetical protein
MAKKEGIGLPQTRGTFQIIGLVTGTEKDSFYKETQTKTTKKPWRILNFGLKTDKEATVYVNLSGGEKDKVFFSKTVTEDNKKKTVTEEVLWKDRFKFNKEGFRLIGVNTGVKKIQDDKGKTVNDKKNLTEYDATKEISENLKDNQSLFIKGNIDYSHYLGNDGNEKRAVKFLPTQVSLCSKDINFDDEKFESTSDFTQIIVFIGIKQDETEKTKFIVSAKIINFNSIEDAEFIVENKDLASTFKKNLKPYTALKVWGKLKVISDVETVSSTDTWGEANDMDKINNPTKRELIITGADKTTIDIETYTEVKIEEAIVKINSSKKAENEFGNDTWGGNSSSSGTSEEEDTAW